jgi:hypothetical protein
VPNDIPAGVAADEETEAKPHYRGEEVYLSLRQFCLEHLDLLEMASCTAR